MRQHRMAAAGDRAVARIEAADGLDGPGHAIGNAIATPFRFTENGQHLRNALHGNWLGHPLHPMLVTVPIGAWTVGTAFDALDAAGLDEAGRYRIAADLSITAGCVGAVAAAVSGMADWNHSHGKDRRVGLAHAAVNTAALGLFGGSLAMRRRGRRNVGRAMGLAGWALTFAGAYLGGHLVYRRRLGVDQADRSPEPRGFRPVLALDQLEEDRPRRIEIWDQHARLGVGVVLVRHRGRVHALGSRCSHMGGPLEEGWILGGGLVCPWHGSRYDLATGRAMDGPSTCPQPRYEVRVVDGVIEIRKPPEPGDETIEQVPPPNGHEPDPDAPTGVEVLVEHHEMLRGLFARIERASPPDPQRRTLLRRLAHELEMHEQIEDEIFYPAVRPVTDEVPLAHAEHRQLTDLLAYVLGLDTASSEFDEHFVALHHAVEHHASAEEHGMFVDAEKLGDERLRSIGEALSARLAELRASRLGRLRRTVKVRALEAL